jgi:hypothetical protein
MVKTVLRSMDKKVNTYKNRKANQFGILPVPVTSNTQKIFLKIFVLLEFIQLLYFDFNADLDPALHPKADSDPASKNNTDPRGSGSLTLIYKRFN